jgi:hypothetical protein
VRTQRVRRHKVAAAGGAVVLAECRGVLVKGSPADGRRFHEAAFSIHMLLCAFDADVHLHQPIKEAHLSVVPMGPVVSVLTGSDLRTSSHTCSIAQCSFNYDGIPDFVSVQCLMLRWPPEPQSADMGYSKHLVDVTLEERGSQPKLMRLPALVRVRATTSDALGACTCCKCMRINLKSVGVCSRTWHRRSWVASNEPLAFFGIPICSDLHRKTSCNFTHRPSRPECR